MRRARFAPSAVFAILLIGLSVSLPAAARTGMLNSDPANECPDVAAAVDPEQAGNAPQPAKPAAAKPGAAPAQNKARPAARGNGSAPVRGPRWHRFLPGMIR
jgi:hypothetical protein